MKTIDSKHFIIDVSLDTKDLTDKYPLNLPVLKNLGKLTFNPNVTFIVGENGAGKSTLLEGIAIAVGFNPEGGSRNFNFETKATHSDLYKHIKITKGLNLPKDGFFLRAETFYNIATEIGNLGYEIEKYYGEKSLHKQSHGESYISLIENRFKANGLYILDEPEAALSPSNQLKFLALIDYLVKKNSQFIIATHSPIIMGYPNAEIYQVDDNSIKKVKYEETNHYLLSKRFLNNKEKVLSELLLN